MAEALIAWRNVHPHDDPLVRRLLQQEPELMSYQHFGAGPSLGASSSHGAGSSHGGGPYDEDVTRWGVWEEEQQQGEQQE